MQKLIKLMPFLIIAISIICGVYKGLFFTFNDSASSISLWSIISIFLLQNNVPNISCYCIFIHNLFLAIVYGVLSFFSFGLFAVIFLYRSWSVWVYTIKTYTNDLLIIVFVLFEAISITLLILLIMHFGFKVINRKKISKWLIFFLSSLLIILFTGAVIETYALKNI